MSEYIVSTDFLSFIFMGIILSGTVINSKKSRKSSTRLFIYMLVVFLFAIPVDTLSYLAESFIKNDALLVFVNMLSYLFIVIVVGMYSLYMVSVIREKSYTSYRVLLPILVITILQIIFIFFGTLNGKLFTVSNHKFHAGPWHLLVYLITLINMLYLCFVLFRYRKRLEIRFIMGLSTYLIFPVFLSICVLLFHFPDFSYATGAASLLIIYVTIQSQTIAEAKVREQILDEVSHTDALTGLKNRRAYDKALEKDDMDSAKGVVFFDLNGLKFANDNFGHAAGDNLIIAFAKLLSKSFADGEVFRISGDEFVVILYLGRQELEKRMLEFRDIVMNNNRIASFGFVHREKGEILQMVNEAEKEMYHDKRKYYEETGKDRRR